jgi:hypothetical protein
VGRSKGGVAPPSDWIVTATSPSAHEQHAAPRTSGNSGADDDLGSFDTEM